eukprot:SAG31_NODE_2314_length_5953_cov_1.996413_3_plen_168_part_00
MYCVADVCSSSLFDTGVSILRRSKHRTEKKKRNDVPLSVAVSDTHMLAYGCRSLRQRFCRVASMQHCPVSMHTAVSQERSDDFDMLTVSICNVFRHAGQGSRNFAPSSASAADINTGKHVYSGHGHTGNLFYRLLGITPTATRCRLARRREDCGEYCFADGCTNCSR